MRTGLMADWRCSFPVQSPAPAGPSTRPQQQHQQSTSPGRIRENFFEAAKVSILRSVPEEGGVLRTQILRSYTNPCGAPQNIRSNCVKMKEVNVGREPVGAIKSSGMMKNETEDASSSYNLRFSLLMENLNEIEDILVDSDMLRLQRDILMQVERLGALKLFHACLYRTHIAPVSLNLALPLNGSEDLGVDSAANAQVSHTVVPSGRKKERKLRRQKASEKNADMPVRVLSSPKDRNDTMSPSTGLPRTDGSKSGRKRLVLARNESKMSIGVKDVAKLERIRDELEERTGRASSFSRWAEAAGTDERTLQQRLHFGWYCKDSLLKSTRSLVIYLARSYRGMGIAFDDLIQAGSIGVLRGAERFDPSRGYRFSTYVQYWIRKSMLAVVGRYSRGIHIPATMEKAIKQVQKARRTLSTAKHRRPLDADVAELTGLSLAKVRLAGQCGRVVGSINQKRGDDLNIKVAETMADVTIRTPEEAVMRQHMRNDVDKLLESLHPRERQVLLLRYGMVDGRRRSLEEIGQLLHVSKEWIRKLEIAGLAKVRKEEIQRELKHYIHPHSI